MPKTVIDIEEERAIRDICYKSGKYEINHPFLKGNASITVNFRALVFFFPLGACVGEYYGIQNPYKHQSTKTVSSPWQDELLPLETTEQNLQKGKYLDFFGLHLFTTSKIAVTGRNYYIVCTSSPLFKFCENKILQEHICICQHFTKLLYSFLPCK